ncbi:MAG: hypothetical protein KJO51_08810 [Gramella sp.]|nr:hypothetical protein [Christiangramia sp.]
MEKQFNREDRLMKKLLNEAGTETPSADFKSRIMRTVKHRNAEIKPYKPLISRSGWLCIAVISTITFTGLYSLYSDISFSSYLNFKFPDLIDIPKLDLSRTMQYAIAFVALFFLQIPFLKRFLDREYQL